MSKEIFKKYDRRTIRSKRDLANALFELLQEKNLDDIIVQDITDRALISKTTFYNNFNDKSELLTFLLRRSADELLEKIELFVDSDSQVSREAIFYEAIKIVVDFLAETALPFKKMIENDKSRTLYWSLTSMIESVFHTLLEDNQNILNKEGLNNDVAIYYYAGAYANLIYKKLANASPNSKIDKDKIVKEIYKLSKPLQE